MYWLFTDETNVDPSQGVFFIYGGIALDAAKLVDVHNSVAAIRESHGFTPDDQLKFQTASRPRSMDVTRWTNAKGAVLDIAHALGLELIIYVVHHGIAAGVIPAQQQEYALNSVISHFNFAYLTEKNDFGAVCVDRLDEKFGYNYLRNRFQKPLDLPDGRTPALERIIHYSMSCDGASHISSVVDIALGSMRYCINTAMGTGNEAVVGQLFPKVSRLLWSKMNGSTHQIGGYGFLQYPKIVKSDTYRADYDTLVRKLTAYSSSQ